ncbi:MAG: DNA polymerase III subunit epsilon [Alphaproteobacteria bacterium RIFOXYD12_FULL_60_8]|nr:MAG: DNA polymerase III subunit epsilon [Alphaproteobacteria bacterium RIFOXYD12_FULL_60_8]
MREIVLDTETTGLSPDQGHRVVEIGCVELMNHLPTGEVFHVYLNPERDMPIEAFNVHGLSEEFLRQHETFDKVAQKFLDFIADAPLIIHNASFDMKFLNAELSRCDYAALPMSRAVDTVILARRKYPGAMASLDALCKRFNIDNSSRAKHGALLDSELLAEVYLELIGGREPGLALAATAGVPSTIQRGDGVVPRPARAHAPSAEEDDAHKAFLEKIKEPIWIT